MYHGTINDPVGKKSMKSVLLTLLVALLVALQASGYVAGHRRSKSWSLHAAAPTAGTALHVHHTRSTCMHALLT